MSTFDDDTQLDFFDEPETRTLESPRAARRRIRRGPAGPRRTPPPPPGAVALARLAGLVGLAIVVVVGLVFWVGSCQGKSRHDEYASYVDAVRPLAQSSAQVGAAFANELGSAKLTLTGFEAKLEGWSHEEQQAYVAAQRIIPPGPLQTAHQQVLDTLQLRAIALAGLADTLAQAKSGSAASDAATVASDLSGQAELLTASDIVWSELFRAPVTATLKRLGVTGIIVPQSQFVTNPDIVSSRSFGIVYARISSSAGGTITGLHGSALVSTVAVDGSATTTLSPTTSTTIHVTSTLELRVTVEDSGSFPEVKIPVTLAVLVSGKPVLTKTQTISSVLPKHDATVAFGNLQLPGSAYASSASVVVRVGKVPGEKNVANNKATYPVFFGLSGA